MHPDISDLFFNRDLDHCKLHELDGKFAGWNEDALKAEAHDFILSLSRLGVTVPGVDELLANFHKRV